MRARKPIFGADTNGARHDRKPRFTEPETLRFGYGDTALGTIVVAESVHGVVALFIGDDRAKLLRDLKERLPRSRVRSRPDRPGADHRQGRRPGRCAATRDRP